MNTAEVKQRIHQYIDSADDRLLRIVDAIIKEDQNTIVAHTADGKPLNIAQYRKEIELGIEDAKAGRVITDEDLEKEIETW